jgi:GAF domain-containing protein
MAGIAIRQGDVYRYVATSSVNPEWAEIAREKPFAPGRETMTGRVMLERQIIHINDVAADPDLPPAIVTIGKIRTWLGAPLMREGELLGLITLAHDQVRPFTERQIELVRTFADQAVIAIENTRLITETREALEQQTATAEVLQVINSSPGDLAPVFKAMLEKAMRLCGAAFGALFTYDGECFPCMATVGFPPGLLEYYRAPLRPGPGSAMGQLVRGQSVSQVTDIRTDELRSPTRRALADLGGARTMIWVALRKEQALLGCIAIYRQEVRPFLEKEIELLENFATQAVIAMDNARLLNEIRQRQAELRVTFDNMGNGVAMFDGELRLAAWNLNFQRILELPDAARRAAACRRFCPLSRDARRVWRGRCRSGGAPAVGERRNAMVDRADAPGRTGHRGAQQPGTGRRLGADLQRRDREEACRGRDPRGARHR